MRSRRIAFLRAAAWTLMSAALLGAQVRVAGRALDENGAPVPAVRVELRPASSPGQVLQAVSDELGRFNIELPAEGAYSVQARKEGFFLLNVATASFQRGFNSLTLTLNHLRELVETVDVTYSPPAVDPVETTERKQLNNMQILEVPFPASQDFRNALPMFGSVLKDTRGQLHFAGGAGNQTAYTLDGFNVADVYNGELEARVSIDAIRELDLESSRFSVESGRGSSGALDIVTGMGDDRLRFGATNFLPGVSAERGLLINKWTPRITVSGPIVSKRAWFHNGFDAFYDVDTIHELPPGQDRSRSLTAGNLSRLQWNPTSAQILTGSLLMNYSETDHFGLSFLSPLEATLHRQRRLGMAALKHQAYLSGRLLLESGFAVARGRANDQPEGDSPYLISPSGFRGNHFSRFSRRTRREQGTFSATLPWNAAGTHELKAGMDAQRSGFDQMSARHDFRILREDGTLARSVRFGAPRTMRMNNLEAALFVRDRWQLREDLVVNGGLRADWDQIVRRTAWSPRVSAAWSPPWLNGIKASAGFGLYNDVLTLEILARDQDQRSLASNYSRNGALVQGPVETGYLTDRRALRTPRSRLYSLGLERMMSGGIHLALNYTRRRGWNGLAFESGGAAVTAPLMLYRLTNCRQDRYDALEATVRSTFAGRFQWSASYVYSRTRSNAVVDYSPENPQFGPQAAGPFDWDAPHRLLVWGWAPLPGVPGPGWMQRALRDTGIAYLMETRSGFPFSVYNEEGVRAGAPNDRRLPAYFNANLHVEKKLRLWGYLWALRAGFNNLTNHGNPNVVNNNVDSPYFLSYGGGQRRASNVRLRFLGRK